VTAGRLAALRERLRAAELDALLVTHLVNLRYLTGFSGSAGSLLVTADGAGEALAVDGRYTERAAAEAPDVVRVTARGLDWVAPRLAAGARLGLEGHVLAWDRVRELEQRLDGVHLVPARSEVEALRAVKDADELALLERAAAATDAAFADLTGWLAPGMTERAVAARLEAALLAAGADEPAFATIVAAGPHAAVPHHLPGDRPLAAGDAVVLDFGGAVGGYRADMTRTVALGRPAGLVEELHALVLASAAAGRAALHDGGTAGELEAACRGPVAAAGHDAHWLHPPGHGLGLEIHEEPIFRAGSAATLVRGMTVALEPGVYVPGLAGVRVEDTLVVGTANPTDTPASRALTRAPRDLAIL
jgi:Xaa-Pro aminopeptidase